MKSEPKAFASLSSGLLARKGAARPAMRPQGFGQGASSLEDLGWNDMGFEPPKPVEPGHEQPIAELPSRTPLAGLTPVDSPVHGQQAEIAGRLSVFSPDDAGDEVDETAEIYEPEAEPDAETADRQIFVAPAVAIEPEPKAEPEPAAPVRQRRAAPARRQRSVARVAGAGKAKAAFTLRLDPQRHLKLRLACAVNGQSAQMLVTEALDQLLGAMPELDSMAAKAKPKG